MFARTISLTVPILAVLIVALPCAQALESVPSQPIGRLISYGLHDDPNDPNSAVIMTVMLHVTLDTHIGNSVGWEITEIEFVEPGVGGADDTVWIESDPNVPSSDGLWWVDHADWTDPQAEEFAEPPHLVGIAAAEHPGDADLEYDFEGDEYTGQGPWDPTGYLNYEFMLDGAPGPFLATADDEPEPVTVEEDEEEPTSGG